LFVPVCTVLYFVCTSKNKQIQSDKKTASIQLSDIKISLVPFERIVYTPLYYRRLYFKGFGDTVFFSFSV